jgi:hypothetical protein
MEHYVTLFDSLFLPQGLALHMSMERHVKGYTLWILCVDDEAHTVLTKLQLPNVRLLQLSKLETQELLRVKPNRSKGEYCWTLTPFAPRFVFEADPVVERVTYLDADLWFRKHPKPIFDEFEFSGKHVLITDHAYAPAYDQSATSGQYCVQFMTFTRNGGEVVRKWWEEKCVDWCYARYEDGKFGDQKYLEEMQDKYKNLIHTPSKYEYFQGPWNATRFPYSQAITYHFHGLRIISKKNIDRGSIYFLPPPVIRNTYREYLLDLSEALRQLDLVNFEVPMQAKKMTISKALKTFVWGVYTKRWEFILTNRMTMPNTNEVE